MDYVVDVELIQKGVAVLMHMLALGEEIRGTRNYLGHGGSKNNDFVKFSNSFHELVDAGSLDDIDVVELALDFHRDCKVGLVKNLTL